MEAQDQEEWIYSIDDPALCPEAETTHPDMATPALVSGGTSAEQDIRALLQALPTRSDIETLILRLEETHCRDFQEVKAEVSTLADRVSSGKGSLTALEQQVAGLERERDHQRDTAVALQLHLEEAEDQSRHNNLRLREIPESVDAETLEEALQGLFREVLEDPSGVVEVDRVHRALGPRSADPGRPRDVVCRLLRYAQKERIVRRAWEQGKILRSGSQVKILPDLSRATLRRRALLKPILDLARRQGFTYRWGYPLSVTFRKDGVAFTVQTPADLPVLFRFLGTDQVPVPDWLQILPCMIGRSGPSAYRPAVQNRQSGRGRRRHRAPSGEEPRE